MEKFAQNLCNIIAGFLPKLEKTDPISAKLKPDPSKWSANEILGHLIDSALNNYQRIVRAQYGAAEQFPGYDQDEWVRIQSYNDIPWPLLVNLWKTLNDHLCILIENIPQDARFAQCNIGKDEPVSLEYVVEDYIKHLAHHLNAIDKIKQSFRP
jgi:hypothetical protein